MTTRQALLRQAVYGRLAGYEDVNDAERLARDPVMRAIVGLEGMDRPAASTSQMGRFETEWLATETNLAALADLSGAWIDRVHRQRPPDGIILDMDSSESPTHGAQEGSAWNGHFGCTCYHPLFIFNQFGDLERSTLRPGNVHSAEGWHAVLEPVIARFRDRGLALYFRGDAAFAKPELYQLLEAEGIGYAIRLPTNPMLQEWIGHLLTRPIGRPPRKPQVFFASFSYQAQSWSKPRRVVAKVEWHQGELYPRVGFILTNLTRPPKRVSKFYNGRGTAEQWIKPVIARFRDRGLALYFRGDAAFAKPELYQLLEAEGIGYAIRLPTNPMLQEWIGHLLTRPIGRPPRKPQVFFASFSYQAQSWSKPRRVVAKVEWHQGELYPRVGFILTNLTRPPKRVSKFYNGRGTAEQWIKMGYPGRSAPDCPIAVAA